MRASLRQRWVVRLHGRVDLEQRIALVASTWDSRQQLHPGNVAWHGTGSDGAPPAEVMAEGEGWFAEAWSTSGPDNAEVAEVDGHFSPRLTGLERQHAWQQVRAIARKGRVTLAAGSDMARTLHQSGVTEVPGPYFLLQHRLLAPPPEPLTVAGYRVVPAAIAGDDTRVRAHREAWAPVRIKRLLGVPITGEEPPNSFDHATYAALKGLSIYRPELDLVALAADGVPAAFALGWYDEASRSVLIEPVGTAPQHTRAGTVSDGMHGTSARCRRSRSHPGGGRTTRGRRLSDPRPALPLPRLHHRRPDADLHLDRRSPRTS